MTLSFRRIPALSIAMLTTRNGKGSCIVQFVSLFLLTVVAAESFNSFDFVRGSSQLICFYCMLLYFVAFWGGVSPSASVAVFVCVGPWPRSAVVLPVFL